MKAIVLAVLAGVFWGVGEVLTKSVLHTGRVGPITAVAVRTAVALPVLAIAYAVVVHGLKAEPADWTKAGAPTLTKLVVGSGVIAGALALLCFYGALNFGEIGRIKPIAFGLAPAVAVVLGWLVLGEAMTVKKVVGVVLVVGGVLVLTGK